MKGRRSFQGHGNLSKYKIKFEDRGDGTYHAHLHDKEGKPFNEKVIVTEDQKRYHETGKWEDHTKEDKGEKKPEGKKEGGEDYSKWTSKQHREQADKHSREAFGHINSGKMKEYEESKEKAREHLEMADKKRNEENKGDAWKDKIIGKTKSGKDVYANSHERENKDWTDQDHDDAMKLHGKGS